MKILVTGANGFIGRSFCQKASADGNEVLGMVRSPSGLPHPEVLGSLEAPPWKQIEAFAPDAVVHLAWTATPGVYLNSPENPVFLGQSKLFLNRCLTMGVRHIAAAGTCIEYASDSGPLDEMQSRLSAAFPYSKAKTELFHWLKDSMAGTGNPWTWFRIFYPYGPGEHSNRLPSFITRQLLAGQPIQLLTPDSIKDYIFIDDLTAAMCRALEQGFTGPLNLGTGRGVRLRDLAYEVARVVDADPSLVGDAVPTARDPWPVMVAGQAGLDRLAWTPRTSLSEGLSRLAHKLQ
ncbi:NAD(P)-dependent oxidoreductase [Prosthecobacter sp. SYSU 5D2]|uniref:NAD-dependent epimerase/dehydratase family protein n=1 Tax=Prosthecobacter sp. SYSU 5D2 TaxID=3134134 RepID=UPI0031FF418D